MAAHKTETIPKDPNTTPVIHAFPPPEELSLLLLWWWWLLDDGESQEVKSPAVKVIVVQDITQYESEDPKSCEKNADQLKVYELKNCQ